MDNNLILIERERRAQEIDAFLHEYPMIISVKANIPGVQKNIPIAKWLVRMFANKIIFDLEVKREYFESIDGPYELIYLNRTNAKSVKTQMVFLEEASLFGRLVDIDVYTLHHEYHREEPRTCLICENQANICRRLQRHSETELLGKTNQMFLDACELKLYAMIDHAILSELNLDPKFGLVTPYSKGSHPDMSYDLMVKAKNAIIPDLIRIFDLSYSWNGDLLSLRNEIREIGKEAEKKMLLATMNINAYKGLIFNLGFVLAALGQVLKSGNIFEDIFTTLKSLSVHLTDELEGEKDTFGKVAYQEMKISGARKEMEEGLPHVKACLTLNPEDLEKKLIQALVYFIIHIEDTNLLKRAKTITKYIEVKDKFSSLDISNHDLVSELSNWSISENLSFGGSADLLIVSVFLDNIRKWLF